MRRRITVIVMVIIQYGKIIVVIWINHQPPQIIAGVLILKDQCNRFSSAAHCAADSRFSCVRNLSKS